MKATVFCSPHWATLQAKALEVWEATRGQGLAVKMLVPTTAMRSYWLSLLAERFGGVMGEQVSVLDIFAELLLEGQGMTRRASPLEQRLAALAAFPSAGLPEEWKQVGIVDAFLSAVEELELHGLTPDEVHQVFPDASTIVALTNWWRGWKEQMRGRGLRSVGDSLLKATEQLSSKPSPPPVQCVLVYGFTALADARFSFLMALLRTWDTGDMPVYFFVPADCDNPIAYAYVMPFIQRLRQELGADVCPLPSQLPDELQKLPKYFFSGGKASQQPLKVTERIVCVAAAGEEQEVETAVRVLAHWRRTGALQRFSDALLIVPSLTPYLPALEGVSARYGVPYRSVTEATRPHRALTKLLWAIWQVRRTGGVGEILWQLLPSPYLTNPHLSTERTEEEPKNSFALLPEQWHRQFLDCVRQHLAGSGSKRWGEILTATFGNEPFVASLFEFMDAVAQLPDKAPISEHARHWQKLLSRFVRGLDERDGQTLRRLNECLNALKGWEVVVSGEEFLALLMDACEEAMPKDEDAFLVATVGDARGMVTPVVVVLGLRDDLFPPPPKVFELLADHHREVLTERFQLATSLRFRRRPRHIPFAVSFAQEYRMLFAEILGIATERLVLAYPRTDPEGKPIARSLFLDETERALQAAGYQWCLEERDLADVVPPMKGERDTGQGIGAERGERKSDLASEDACTTERGQQTQMVGQPSRLLRGGQRILPASVRQALSNHEAAVTAVLYAFSLDAAQEEVGLDFAAALLREPLFRERLWTERKRWESPQEGRWDGKDLCLDTSPLRERWEREGLHVTALEDYGQCPFRFFARHVLGLSLPQEVTYAIDPALLGKVFHAIMKAFLDEFAQSRKLPDKERLKAIARSALPPLPEPMGEILWRRIEKALPKVWEAEKAQVQRQRWRPIAAELSKEVRAGELGDVPQGWEQVRLCMRLDRVDEREGKEGREKRVADYKTGSAPRPKDVKQGLTLQLPLYAWALQREGHNVTEALFLKLLSFTQEGYSTSCPLVVVPQNKQMHLCDAIEQGRRWASQYLQGIASANFVVQPFDPSSSCRRCEFKPLCRHHPLRLRGRGKERTEE